MPATPQPSPTTRERLRHVVATPAPSIQDQFDRLVHGSLRTNDFDSMSAAPLPRNRPIRDGSLTNPPPLQRQQATPGRDANDASNDPAVQNWLRTVPRAGGG